MFWFIILLAVAAFLYWVSNRPDHFSLARSITINATPAQVHPWINNLKQMNQWNPWAAQDAKSNISYEGPEAGPGAIYTWAGGKMGQGRFEIRDTTSAAITARLQMIKPMAADNSVVFSMEPEGAATKVTWNMTGENRFIHKLMQIFMSMDKMVGNEFDKGLAGLKALVEQKTLN